MGAAPKFCRKHGWRWGWGKGDTAILGKKVTFENYRLSPPPSSKFFWELGFGRGVGGECVGEGDAFLAAIFNIYQIIEDHM